MDQGLFESMHVEDHINTVMEACFRYHVDMVFERMQKTSIALVKQMEKKATTPNDIPTLAPLLSADIQNMMCETLQQLEPLIHEATSLATKMNHSVFSKLVESQVQEFFTWFWNWLVHGEAERSDVDTMYVAGLACTLQDFATKGVSSCSEMLFQTLPQVDELRDAVYLMQQTKDAADESLAVYVRRHGMHLSRILRRSLLALDDHDVPDPRDTRPSTEALLQATAQVAREMATIMQESLPQAQATRDVWKPSFAPRSTVGAQLDLERIFANKIQIYSALNFSWIRCCTVFGESCSKLTWNSLDSTRLRQTDIVRWKLMSSSFGPC